MNLRHCRNVRKNGGMIRCNCGEQLGVLKLDPVEDFICLLSFVRPVSAKPDSRIENLRTKRSFRCLVKRINKKSSIYSTDKSPIPSTSKAYIEPTTNSRKVTLARNKDYAMSCAIEYLQGGAQVEIPEEMDVTPVFEVPDEQPNPPVETNTEYFSPNEGKKKIVFI